MVIDNVHKGKKRLVEKTKKNNLKHRLHQWSIVRLVEVLNSEPVHVVEVSEAYPASRDPFTGKPIARYTPSVIRIAVRGWKRVKVAKVLLRLARLGNGLTLDRDVILELLTPG
ncbi:hypothetical protein DKAM_0959 [Desulfurococcus amylolyticus 1221n]|uniref:Uncharacterized protein n=1 Tax=Desulfurococcus amylolyticus (strain DSM 18924 / JCM 16383 / VKM B-2413 / 1221n) TaxID=490899 RepID=B8D5A4_DESA1|nr:hypothetical protein [Desulfurococcus amylolyticus]ACL11285.1 hypothetical protein DKAM_0959 [Desulfurococcus amylolyticus 1221n]